MLSVQCIINSYGQKSNRSFLVYVENADLLLLEPEPDNLNRDVENLCKYGLSQISGNYS